MGAMACMSAFDINLSGVDLLGIQPFGVAQRLYSMLSVAQAYATQTIQIGKDAITLTSHGVDTEFIAIPPMSKRVSYLIGDLSERGSVARPGYVFRQLFQDALE